MILVGIFERSATMPAPENCAVGSKEYLSGTRKRNDQLAGRDSE